MKILTLNCQKGYNPNIKDFFIKILQNREYDFILLQEVNETVYSIISEINSEYNILNQFDTDLEEDSHVCILYKNKFTLLDTLFISFARSDTRFPPRGWGCIGGMFQKGGTEIFATSVHLHPGFRANIRAGEVRTIKEKILEKRGNRPVIIGGDFNTGLPFEISNHEQIVSPEFVRATKDLGTTLDSQYTEKTPFLITKIANTLSVLGISIKLRADHIYVDRLLADENPVCKILPDRVSDHSPVECAF